jgi:hypothetical protein
MHKLAFPAPAPPALGSAAEPAARGRACAVCREPLQESVHSMLLQVRAHARAFAKFANVLPISMQNKCYSRSICMPVWFSRGHGRDIKGHGMLFYMR